MNNKNAKMKELLENKDLKQFPFDTPDGYFAALENKMFEKIEQEESVGKRAIVFRSFKAYAGMAASFLLLLGVAWGVMKLTQTSSSQISGEMTAQEILDNLDNIDSLEAVYLIDNFKSAIAEGEDISKVLENEQEQINEEDFDEAVKEYLMDSPSSMIHLLAEGLKE